MVYINGVLINSNLWHCLMMCITLINGLVLINAYIGVNHRLQNLLMYGNEDIEKLATYYGIDKMDGDGNVMEKVINGNDVKQEWEVAKYYMKQIRNQDIVGGWENIFHMYPDFSKDFPNVVNLVKILLIIPLSNAQVERIFSQHKLTKTQLRNRMSVESLNQHLILLNGPDDF